VVAGEDTATGRRDMLAAFDLELAEDRLDERGEQMHRFV
jgi:hypothetical protein